MLFNAFAKTAILAVALTASTAVAAPVPRDVGNTIEAVSSIPLAGAVMVARGRSSKNPVAAPAPATPAQPPGTVKLVDPASSNNQVSQPAAVEAFLNPTDKKTKNHLNSALDDAAVGRVGTLHSVDKKGNMPAKNELQNTGLRVDGQGGSPEGQKANVQVQVNGPNGGKSTCATCIVHTDPNNKQASGQQVKDALLQSSQTEKVAHLWPRMLFVRR